MKITLYFASLALALSLLAPPSVLAAPTELHLKPTSKWNVNYADDYCRLARIFGDGDQQVVLFMDRYSPSEAFRLTFSGKLVKTSDIKQKIKLHFGPSEEKQEVAFTAGEMNKKMPALIIDSALTIAPRSSAELEAKILAEKNKNFDPDSYSYLPIGAARETAVTFLAMGAPLRKHLVLETGSMGKPMAALQTCMDELVTHWGVDVKRHAELTRRAVPLISSGKWLSASDYPMGLLNKGQPGIVNFRLSIDDKGVPSACHIQITLRERGFDDAVCKALIRKARFKPALDADKLPIASYYLSTVRFQIPD
jgi:Gram-negative bacterial TonB protein C-terminal